MKVSFIIPLHNCLPLTQAMLESLRATLPAGLSHEIIFVDDASSDGTREWLKTVGPALAAGPASARNPGLPASRFDGLKVPSGSRDVSPTIGFLLNERNLGFAATCNRGAAAAHGELLFFLNNDLVLLPGWLEPMLAVFDRFPNAGVVGNVQLSVATGRIDHTGIFFDEKGKPAHATHRGLASSRRVDAVTGACLALRAAVWQKLGGFDEGYLNGCEDIDLCLRALEAGHTNHVALRSVVRHHISASIGRKLRDEQNTARLLRRWRPFILPRLVRPGCHAWLRASWEEPRDYPDPALARDAFLHLCGLLPWPTHRLRQAAAALVEVETARWAHLFDGAPARSAREIAWQLYPHRPATPPVF